MTYVAGSAVPTGCSPTSVEQAPSTSARRRAGVQRGGRGAQLGQRRSARSPARHLRPFPAAAFAAAQ